MILQAPRRWVSSPLGINMLLAICGENSDKINKYVQIYNVLKNKKEIKTNNMLYHSPCLKSEHVIKNSSLKVEIAKTGKMARLHDWVSEHILINGNIGDKLFIKSNLILSNISNFKASWSLLEVSGGPQMKIYNSFSYTQDVKYEARILELSVQDEDFKLVIIVPNEADVLHKLFERLNTEGLTAAVNSVQPLFTATSELKAPCIDVVSEIGLKYENSNDIMNNTAIQLGIAKIDAEGAQVEVVTNIYSALAKTPPIEESKIENPFYFAITFKDTPIFTGQYTQE